MPSGHFYLYSLDRSISYIRGVLSVFISIMFCRSLWTWCKQCRPRSDAAEHASYLGLHCLSMSLLWDAKLKWVKQVFRTPNISNHLTNSDFRNINLTFTTLWPNSADDKFIIFPPENKFSHFMQTASYLFSPENRIWHFMQIVSIGRRQFA